MNGLTFYKLISPYLEDVTKGSGLYGREIDSNFMALKDADKELFDLISTGYTSLNNQITGETASRIAGDLSLQNQITGLTMSVSTGYTSLNNQITGETASRIAGDLVTDNIYVSLPINKSLGKYINGQIIDVGTGMTLNQLFKDIASEALEPTVILYTQTSILFNQTNINNILNFTFKINSLSSIVNTTRLDWRRNGSGVWVTLTGTTGTTATGNTFTHSITDTPYNSQPFNYRYVVTDTSGGVSTGTTTITPPIYLSPSISLSSVGLISRDLGNVNTTISATIARNSVNVPLVSYKIQRSVNAGGYIDISTGTTSVSGVTVSYIDNNTGLTNSASIAYRVLAVDGYQTTTGSASTINFYHRSVLGYSAESSITISDIIGFTGYTLTNSRPVSGVTISNVNPGILQYTYYTYNSILGDLVSIKEAGVEEILTAFTKLPNVVGVNQYGATVSYSVYKSNAPGAFINKTLVFS